MRAALLAVALAARGGATLAPAPSPPREPPGPGWFEPGVIRHLDVRAPHGGPVDVTYPLSFGIP
jgi:hypothetical protein